MSLHEPLKENQEVRQREEEGWRRWFVNDYFDIILWYNKKGGDLIGFQVCYGRGTADERAYTYEFSSQSHHFVAEGQKPNSLGNLGTAILTGDAGRMPQDVLDKLVDEAGDLPPNMLRLILEKAGEFNSR